MGHRPVQPEYASDASNTNRPAPCCISPPTAEPRSNSKLHEPPRIELEGLPMSSRRDDYQPGSEDGLDCLNHRQKQVYSSKLARFTEYLSTVGQDPIKEEGYAEGTVQERISRFQRAVSWLWSETGVTTSITPADADEINEALYADRFRKRNGDPYSNTSKRKINDVLKNWFEFTSEEWTPTYTFTDNRAKQEEKPDPFTKSELVALWESSLSYKSIPSYSNLSPTERDRWRAHIAQELGKPKEEVTPDDWDRINRSWKIPSLIRINRGHGLRPDLIARVKLSWYDPDKQKITVPAGEAPKNDAEWTIELIEEEALALENWLAQRELIDEYQGREEIWLNREGNPYRSGPLNDILDALIEDAGIDPRGRKLVWYSFRHSIGTYVYAETKDLELVAEQLRQTSTAAAAEYVHVLPERKREAAKLL